MQILTDIIIKKYGRNLHFVRLGRTGRAKSTAGKSKTSIWAERAGLCDIQKKRTVSTNLCNIYGIVLSYTVL